LIFRTPTILVGLQAGLPFSWILLFGKKEVSRALTQ